ncbi:MAG: protein-L-isoaspartate O-methyltransferase [Candidatus Omnitrophota bacterium]|nr:protein-L-isoaspartate O-methyltransferase [Candidatus Omnitrophota bacterium]
MININPFVSDFIKQGVLKTPRIIEAFEKIDRVDFVLQELKEKAYINEPLPIREGQTISQPLTVAFMIELLQPRIGDKIFEVGFGSGWQTALLAEIIGGSGRVFAVERIKELFKFGAGNISKYNFIKKGIIKTILSDATMGLKKYAPFDKIIAGASGDKVPEVWLKELKIGGRLVMPIKESIWLYIKKSEKEFEKQEFPGFVFVPLVSGKK